MQSIVSISNLTKTYASGLQALKRSRPGNPQGRDLCVAGPERRRQDHADQHRLRDRHADHRRRAGRRPRHHARLPRVPRDDRSGAPGTAYRHVRDGMEHGQLQPGSVRERAQPGASGKGTARSVAVGEAKRQDHDPVRRDEAPRADRQGARARAGNPVPRRADGGRGRGAAPRHVGAGAAAARERRDHYPHDPLY